MKVLVLIVLLWLPMLVQASPEQVYHQSLQLASAGHQAQAIDRLQKAANKLPDSHVWRQRMTDAAILIEMKKQQQTALPHMQIQSTNMIMAQAYVRAKQAPEISTSWLPRIFASILPGSGHAWMGRWHDAWVSALMVWPMLILSAWAFVRRMGPVTVFFGGITAWLWSGTVFSVVSLSERLIYEQYVFWWQGLWQATALPGLMP